MNAAEHANHAPAGVHRHIPSQIPFRSPVGLRNLLLAATAVFVLLNMALAAQVVHILALFGQVNHGVSAAWRSELQASGHRQLLLGATQALTVGAMFALGAAWIHRAAANVRALGARGLADSPAWAVGWYFVPFANLVRPFRAMQDIWHASLSPTRWERLNTHPLLGAWWATFLAAAIYGSFAVAQQSTSGTVYAMHAQELMVLWLQPLASAAAVLFAGVVWRITDMQREQRARQLGGVRSLHGAQLVA